MPGSWVYRRTDKADCQPATRGVQRKALLKGAQGEVQDRALNATLERNPQEKGKFRLCIDGMPILEWFKMKFQEFKEKLGVSHTQKEENTPKRGVENIILW